MRTGARLLTLVVAAATIGSFGPPALAVAPTFDGTLAIQSFRDGNGEIYLVTPSAQTNLTNNAADDDDASWSPDGSKIAFKSNRDGDAEIWVMNADGSAPANLTNDPGGDFYPTWSPDGSKIAFHSARGGAAPEIYVMNADGSAQTNLTNDAATDIFPVWSPDGAKIAWASLRDGNPEIYVMNADGTSPTRLTTNSASDMIPAWSPDSSTIAFTSNRDGAFEIYVMDADGTGQTRITTDLKNSTAPAFSPDGSQIAYQSDRSGNPDAWLMAASGGDSAQLTTPSAYDGDPDWKPPEPDATAPSVTLDAVATPTADDTPSFTGAAGTAAGDSTTVTLKIYTGATATGIPVQTIPATAVAGSWSTSAASLLDGTFTAQAEQQDAVPNTGFSVARTFQVDTTPPSSAATAPASDDDGTFSVGYSASDSGGAGLDDVHLYVKGPVSGTFTLAATDPSPSTSGSFPFTATEGEGSYEFYTVAVDALGHEEPAPSAADATTLFVTVSDTTPPAVTLDPVTSPTGDDTPAFAGTAGTDAGDSTAVTLKIYPGSTASGIPTQTITVTASAGSWSATASSLTDGTYTAQAEQQDDVPNTGFSEARTFVVDTDGPAVTLNAVTTPTNDSTPTLSGAAGTADGDLNAVTLRIYPGGSASGVPVQTLAATAASGAWAATASVLADGTYTAQAEQQDSLGNVGLSQARTFVVDTDPPDVTISGTPAEGATTTATSASFTFTADEAGATFECKLDAGAWSACNSGSKSYTGLALGSHTFRVRAMDQAGNLGPEATRSWFVYATTSLIYNGQQIVNQGSKLLLGAKLSSSAQACRGPGRPLRFQISPNPTTGSGVLAISPDPTTDSSGQATKSISTNGWLLGVYTIHVEFLGTATCTYSGYFATLTVASPGDSANGGGWYTLPGPDPGSGRVNFGFTVQKVPNTDPAEFRGQFLLINNGKWRLKGTLDQYSKSGNKASVSGTGDLFYWNQTLNGGLGDWVLAEAGVEFSAALEDNGSGGKKSAPDKFGVIIDHEVASPPEPKELPNSTPQSLKGGNITIR